MVQRNPRGKSINVQVYLDAGASFPYSMRVDTNAAAIGFIDGENIIVRQSWINQWLLVCVTLLFEVAIVFLNLTLADSGSFELGIGSFSIPTTYLPIIPLLVLATAAWKIYNERLVITPHYLIHVTGRLWWSARTTRLDYNQVQEIETIQTIPQRILGVADLHITPIGRDVKGSIMIRGLRNPRGVKDLIRNLRSQQSGTSNTVTSAN